MLIGFTVVVRIFAKPGKSDQRWLEKINLHCLSFWSFIISWNKWFSPTHVGHNYWYPFIKYFLQTPSEFSPIMLMCLENTWQEIRDHSSIQNLSRSFRFTDPCWFFFSSVQPMVAWSWQKLHFVLSDKCLWLCDVCPEWRSNHGPL